VAGGPLPPSVAYTGQPSVARPRFEIFERQRPPAHPYRAAQQRQQQEEDQREQLRQRQQQQQRWQQSTFRPAKAPYRPSASGLAELRPEREPPSTPQPAPSQLSHISMSSTRMPPMAPAQPAEAMRSISRGSRPQSASRSVGSLVFLEEEPPELWTNKLEELRLRVELERIQRIETQTELELQRRKHIADEARRFATRSGPAMSETRFDFGPLGGRAQRSSVDRIIFGRDIDGSEEVEGFKGQDWSMFGPRRKKQHWQRQMVSQTDMVIFGRDLDFSGDPVPVVDAQMGRSRDQRQFRSEADMAIFGHDQDGSNRYESQSRRMDTRMS